MASIVGDVFSLGNVDLADVESLESELRVLFQGRVQSFVRSPMPDHFLRWQCEQRMGLFERLRRDAAPGFFTPHLPTLISMNPAESFFPVNAACKGVGLVPDEDHLDEVMEGILSVLDSGRGDCLDERLKAAELLYGHPERVSRFFLGGLEIFEAQSFANIVQNPFVSLFFVGSTPGYPSYQVNCVAEVVEPGDRFYGFVSAMRRLFEDGSFHFQQPAYPFAVRYHVLSVVDKSLRVRPVSSASRSSDHVS